jgi:hypothetical protein
VAWLQLGGRNGAAHKKTPDPSVNGTTNGCRQSAQAWPPLLVNVFRKELHPVVSAPRAQADCASARSCGVQAPASTVGVGVIVPAGQPGYDAGQVVWTPVQPRGVWFTAQVFADDEQSRHAIPPDPHCVSRNPSWHAPLPSQQPSGQLDGVQGGGATTQAPFEQTSPIDPQSLHVLPPAPHALEAVPPRHFPLGSQQPAQVPGPHGCATHAPPTHEAPVAVQFWHADPPLPHASACPPSPQTPPWQQPVHVTGPHVASHEPLTQTLPVPHAWHCAPATPHAPAAVPPRHWLPAQHPEQLDGPHAAFTSHAPFAHCVPGPHAAQVLPPDPQAESFVPGRQRLPSQQPVGQLEESQGPRVWQTLATQLAAVPHAWQASPPEPQASFEPPPTQLLPLQQPAHDCGPHPVGAAHTPAAHTCSAEHDAQVPPPPPQADPLVPA